MSHSATPSLVLGTGAGTGATLTMSGNDCTMFIQITTGTGCMVSAIVGTITYSNAFPFSPLYVPYPTFSPASDTSAAVSVYLSGMTRTSFQLWSTASALADSTSYAWNIQAC